MRVLFDRPMPFWFEHGGLQVQIEQTRKGLEEAGVETDWLRWWDESQTGDVIHYFGRPTLAYITGAHRRGAKVVVAELLTGLGSRKPLLRAIQKRIIATLKHSALFERMGWRSYEAADAAIAGTPWEARLMREIFRARPERVHVVQNGVERAFRESPEEVRGEWLVCMATITERKRVFELASAAVAGGVPVWIVGRPYSEDDPYYRKFQRFVAGHQEHVRYEGPVQSRSELAAIYRQARGFVLLSTMESLSLASFEAAACRCPLLLSDLPWARTTFEEKASYCPVPAAEAVTARHLRDFHENAAQLPLPPVPPTWGEIGTQFRRIYESISQV